MRVSMKEFEELVQTVLGTLPKEFLPYLENTVFIVEERSRRGLMGLYEGATALSAGHGYGYPERITLYKESHERASRTLQQLITEVRHTILHEVGHHFGMEEDELPF